MPKTVIHSYPNLRTVCLGIVTHHGAAHDLLAGTTQVLLQTMSRGTEQHNEETINKKIYGTGGSLFSTTEKDFSIIGAQIQPKYAIRTLELLFELLSIPTLEDNHFQIEKQNLIQIFHQVQSNSLRRLLLFDADKAVFGENHPLGRSQIGIPETLNQITQEDLQETHQELLIKPWGFAVGAISSDLHKQLDKKFHEFISSQKDTVQSLQTFPARSVPPSHIVASPSKEDGSVYLCVNIITDSSPSYIGLARFSSALIGESFGSRMFTILRDQKAFGYLTGASIKLLDNVMVFRYFMETSPNRTEEAIEALLEVITDIGKKEISQKEYNTTRDFILGQLDLAFDDSQLAASKIINRGVHGLPPNIEAGYEELQAVTTKKLNQWWKKSVINPDNFSLAITGDINIPRVQDKWKSLSSKAI
ncbi:MAG: insulinase family protein [Candidatus Heimdallarchaeota archaeon]|nr:MAG: insulinase family protein [Candidatus Heimdallarchaeota archaeon]